MNRDVYTHGHHESVLRSHKSRTAENSAAYVLPHLRGGLSLLDVGCGPGTLTVDLARRVAPGAVTGIDAADGVLAEARAHAQQAGSAVTWETGDVYALRFADASFDVVHAHQVLQHLSDPVAALREMRRVAKPDGVVSARDSDYSCFAWAPLDPLLTRWLELYCAVARRNRAEPDAGRFLKAWARAAGFKRTEISSSTWTYADPQACGWWGSLWAERAEKSAFAQQALEYGLATRAELAEIARAWQRWSEHPDAYFTIPHGELIATP